MEGAHWPDTVQGAHWRDTVEGCSGRTQLPVPCVMSGLQISLLRQKSQRPSKSHTVPSTGRNQFTCSFSRLLVLSTLRLSKVPSGFSIAGTQMSMEATGHRHKHSTVQKAGCETAPQQTRQSRAILHSRQGGAHRGLTGVGGHGDQKFKAILWYRGRGSLKSINSSNTMQHNL